MPKANPVETNHRLLEHIERTRAASGVPRFIEDADAIERIARLISSSAIESHVEPDH